MSFNSGEVNTNDAKELGEFNFFLSTQAYVNGYNFLIFNLIYVRIFIYYKYLFKLLHHYFFLSMN